MNKCAWDETRLKPCETQALDCSSCDYYQEEQSRYKCVECYHYKVCFGFGYILAPLNGGVICEDFINANNVTEIKRGRWIIPTKIGIRSFNIPHCSVCDGVPCGVDSNTKYCPECGAKMDGG